jgi:hypothetical protein
VTERYSCEEKVRAVTGGAAHLAAAIGLKAAPNDERNLGVLPGVDRKNPAPDESDGRSKLGRGRLLVASIPPATTLVVTMEEPVDIPCLTLHY